MLSHIKREYLLYIYLIIWFAANLLFLTEFPFVHTDEPWLSGLSRTMIEERSAAATEDFFDLQERNPHAIKILFHALQAGAIGLLGYSLKTVRLLSLISGVFSLILMYRLTTRILTVSYKKIIALVLVLWMSLDVQFLYMSHFARQEIYLLLLLLIMLNILVSTGIRPILRGAATGMILGLAVGFHPNSFIIAWPVGLFLLIEIIRKKRRTGEGAAFIIAAAALTSLFLLISLHFNGNFISDYRSYGAPLGVLDAPDMKILKLPGFYKKLFFQRGGTYYTPDIRLQMGLFLPLLITALFRKRGIISICGFLGINIALVFIGKYSQPSIIFLLPFYYLLWAEIIDLPIVKYFAPVLMALTCLSSIVEISKEVESFSHYTEQLDQLIPPGTVALGNMYSEYAMDDGHYYDWRNLQYLKENEMSLRDYIETRDIEYIIFAEELTFIYNKRPYWNVIYGNPAHWYPDLVEFTESECSLVDSFDSPAYAMRISAYRYSKPWSVKIFKVNR